MSKFKVGDRVRVVKHCNHYGDRILMGVPLGEIRRVERLTPQLEEYGKDAYLLDGDGVYIYSDINLEAAPKFKVGDRVVAVDCTAILEKGSQHTVTRVDKYGMVYVSFPRYGELSYKAEYFELITPATPSPVRTVTRREIVPGTYDIINVFPDGRVDANCNTPAEMREAARIFNEIADALDEVGA